MRLVPTLLTLVLAAFPAHSQSLAERYKESSRGWEMLLERGDGASARKSAEAMIQRDAPLVSSTDYNEMRALVALYDVAARACVLEGAWEDAIAHLQKAVGTATTNIEQAETTFGRIRREHEAKLSEWRETIAKYEKRLAEMESAPGLPQQELRAQRAIKDSLVEHRNAVAHSEKSLKDIQNLLNQIRGIRDIYTKSLLDWQGFLAKEREELSQSGASTKYAREKLEQVKADDARPKFERLAYGRRLQRLDPDCQDCTRFVNGLMGLETPSEALPAAEKTTRKAKRKKK